MRKIRKIVLGLSPIEKAMHYDIGKEVFGQYTIDSIIDEGESFSIFIVNKDKEILPWKEISKNTAWTVEYSQDFG